MGKIKTYSFSDFATTQDDAIQRFLHHAHDHLSASRELRAKPIFLDSSAYLCNIAFELLLKAMHMAENGRFKGIHNLISLHNSLNKKIFANRDMPLIRVIDKYGVIRYPVDQNLDKSQKKLRLGGDSCWIDEIGTDTLEKADKLFFKIWRKLGRSRKFKIMIKKIHDNPYKKGNRIYLSKPR